MLFSGSQDRIVGARAEPGTPPGEASALLAALRQVAGRGESDRASPSPPDHRPLSLQEAYRTCTAITRRHSRSFFLSSQLLPSEKRRAIRALYAFCRTSDDLVDLCTEDAAGALADWVALVHAPRPPAGNAVLLAWHDTVIRYGIPRALVDELLAGLAMDLTRTRYATFEVLELYCYRVASVVGLIAMHITGHRAGATNYAIKLGIALQLTNILRDVGEDAARGRVYLPQEDLARFRLCDDDILSGGQDPGVWTRDERFRELMRFEIDRANRLYQEAWPGIALLSQDSRFAIGAAAEIYRGILARISANSYDVFARRAHVPLAEKLLILLRVWWRLRAENREPRIEDGG